MDLQTFKANGLAQLSYMLSAGGEAAVIDPARDIAQYLDALDQEQLKLKYIIETHIHADFVCGSHELAAVTGAEIVNGPSEEYGYYSRQVGEGETLPLGELELRILETPGHSPEHISLVVKGGDGAPEDWGVFTGDTLFAGSVGRPDLAAGLDKEDLAGMLYHSLFEKLLPLGDDLIVYPGHGSGSACGGGIGDRDQTTLGYERKNNPKLQADGKEDFIQLVLSDLPDEPQFYARLKQENAEGADLLGGLPHLEPLTPERVEELARQDDTVLVDGREITAFGSAHITGSLSLPVRQSFPNWAGRLIDPEENIVLIADNPDDVAEMQTQLFRIGLDNIVGYLQDGLRSWLTSGREFDQIRDVSAGEVREWIDRDGHDLQLLDVRSDAEWQNGHLPQARHIFAADLREHLGELDPHKKTIVYCGSDYRANAAASVLRRNGFQKVDTLAGSFKSWTAAGYPVTRE